MEYQLLIDAVGELGWGVQVLGIVTATLLLRLVALRLLKVLDEHFSKTENTWDNALLAAARPPLSWLILILGLLFAVELSAAHLEATLFSAANLAIIRQLTLVFTLSFFLVRFIALFEDRYLAKARDGKEVDRGDGKLAKVDPTTVHALARVLRLSVLISAALVALPTLGIEITALLAFGGVGGIAVGFAAQDMLSNFFGGLMIYLDRPFAIGDWIRSPDREIEGVVEAIGWRQTIVRTFDKRPLYIPNSTFSKLALENPSRMQNRRIKATIGIRYQDAAKMREIVAAVKSMLQGHPDIDTTQTLIVNFDAYNTSSLDFFIYTFTKTTDWIQYHEIKQDVMLRIIDIVHAHGADFAFPTRTLVAPSGPPEVAVAGLAVAGDAG